MKTHSSKLGSTINVGAVVAATVAAYGPAYTMITLTFIAIMLALMAHAD